MSHKPAEEPLPRVQIVVRGFGPQATIGPPFAEAGRRYIAEESPTATCAEFAKRHLVDAERIARLASRGKIVEEGRLQLN